MAQQQQQQQGGGGDNSLDFVWIVVLIGVIVAVVWYFGRDYIVDTVFHIRLAEMAAVSYILDAWAKIATVLHLPVPSNAYLAGWTSYVETAKYSQTTFSDVIKLSTFVGTYIRYPVMLVLSGMSVLLFFTHAGQRFKSTYSMEKLRDLEKENWPQVNPICKLDLVKEDISKGPWAMSYTPMQFAKKNKLVKEETKDGKPAVTVISGAARRVFSMQLGAQCRNPDQLPVHVKALYGVFAARAARDRDGAAAVLEEISLSSANGQLNFKKGVELFHKHKNNKYSQETLQHHAYALTIMATMLGQARADGVIAVADFLWLKAVDRPLWYMLCNVGRQTAFPEIAGAFAHWLVEKQVGRPLFVPMVDQAVQAFELAIADVKYVPGTEQ